MTFWYKTVEFHSESDPKCTQRANSLYHCAPVQTKGHNIVHRLASTARTTHHESVLDLLWGSRYGFSPIPTAR
jgi:hypothetical protein